MKYIPVIKLYIKCINIPPYISSINVHKYFENIIGAPKCEIIMVLSNYQLLFSVAPWKVIAPSLLYLIF